MGCGTNEIFFFFLKLSFEAINENNLLYFGKKRNPIGDKRLEIKNAHEAFTKI